MKRCVQIKKILHKIKCAEMKRKEKKWVKEFLSRKKTNINNKEDNKNDNNREDNKNDNNRDEYDKINDDKINYNRDEYDKINDNKINDNKINDDKINVDKINDDRINDDKIDVNDDKINNYNINDDKNNNINDTKDNDNIDDYDKENPNNKNFINSNISNTSTRKNNFKIKRVKLDDQKYVMPNKIISDELKEFNFSSTQIESLILFFKEFHSSLSINEIKEFILNKKHKYENQINHQQGEYQIEKKEIQDKLKFFYESLKQSHHFESIFNNNEYHVVKNLKLNNKVNGNGFLEYEIDDYQVSDINDEIKGDINHFNEYTNYINDDTNDDINNFNDIIDNDYINNDIISNDYINNDIISNDYINNDIISNYINLDNDDYISNNKSLYNKICISNFNNRNKILDKIKFVRILQRLTKMKYPKIPLNELQNDIFWKLISVVGKRFFYISKKMGISTEDIIQHYYLTKNKYLTKDEYLTKNKYLTKDEYLTNNKYLTKDEYLTKNKFTEDSHKSIAKNKSKMSKSPGRMPDIIIHDIIETEWTDEEKRVFEEQYLIHDTKWDEYKVLTSKSNEDLKMYLRYYLKLRDKQFKGNLTVDELLSRDKLKKNKMVIKSKCSDVKDSDFKSSYLKNLSGLSNYEFEDIEIKNVDIKNFDLKDVDIKDSNIKDIYNKDSGNKDIKDNDLKDVNNKDTKNKDSDIKDNDLKDVKIKDSNNKDEYNKDEYNSKENNLMKEYNEKRQYKKRGRPRKYNKERCFKVKKEIKDNKNINISKDELLKKWSTDERQMFAIFFPYIQKNWSKLKIYIPNKTVSDYREYYKNYYKLLSANEKILECNLQPVDEKQNSDSGSQKIK
ncbi:hypothetical protein DMUE_3172 [Dictyocoela muelleri]|nr:hypothetical protein DMUE_3172 [Dictyocoela muelleri]